MGEIFHGLFFHGVKFSWLKPPMKIGHHENFATLTVCSMERWLLSSEKSYVCVDTTFTTKYIWEAAVGEMPVCVRNTHDSYAAVDANYLWWQNFRGFNFRG